MAQKITAADIKKKHPLKMVSPTVFAYANFANKVLNQLKPLQMKVGYDDVIQKTAVNIALYMEDIIADCGVWKAFVQKHHELYGKHLPFYDVDEATYYLDEPNLPDIQFLIWLTLNNSIEEAVNPTAPFILETAQSVFLLCEEAFEELPMNEALANFFRAPTFLNDFISMRSMLKWFQYDCYLTFTPHLAPVIEHEFEAMAKVMDDPSKALYLVCCDSIFQHLVGPLAYHPAEWLRLILLANGKTTEAQLIENLRFEDHNLFKVLEKTEEGLLLETGKGEQQFMTYQGLNCSQEDVVIGEIVSMSAVHYNGRWELNGVMSYIPSHDIFEKEKAYNIANQNANIGIPEYKNLMKLSGGSPLFYLKDTQAYSDFLINQMKLKNAMDGLSALPKDAKDIVVFLPDEHKGFVIIASVARYINDIRNPCYNPNIDLDSCWKLFTETPQELLSYLFEHNLLESLTFPVLNGDKEQARKLVAENWDFLARCYKRMWY